MLAMHLSPVASTVYCVAVVHWFEQIQLTLPDRVGLLNCSSIAVRVDDQPDIAEYLFDTHFAAP